MLKIARDALRIHSDTSRPAALRAHFLTVGSQLAAGYTPVAKVSLIVIWF
jgi:hypothetical protein